MSRYILIGKEAKRSKHVDPTGEVKEVVDGEAKVTTKRGNEIKKNGDEENPAVVLHTSSGSDAIKKVSATCFHAIALLKLTWARCSFL